MVRRISLVLERGLIALCITLIGALAVLIVVAATSRKMGASLSWYDEVASVMLAWITYYGAALAALKRAHLGFPNLVALMPAAVRVPLTVFTEALVIGFFALVTWFGYRVIMILQGDGLVSLPWVPVMLTQSVIPIAGALFILAEILTLPERFHEAVHGKPPPDPEQVIGGVVK